MHLEKVYEKLEQEFIKCRDLKDISIKESNENFISLSKLTHRHIKIRYEKLDMLNHFNGEMIVRQSVGQKLINIANHLQNNYAHLALIIVYGYRTDEIQKKYFFKYLRIIEDDYPWIENKDELHELVHMGVACPDVAGHPTGGAVDIAIYDLNTKEYLDMGAKILDYTNSKKSYTYSPEIDQQHHNNRMFLKTLMENEDFAPYLGEWWHFSYGDREWAKYYNKPFALYQQVPHEEVIVKEN
ncbi:MAG: D-alanyl-D-alanine dipeptidase [uncultured Sulfurovum sp.]|uniref:D-alanyl-D-alanine dipeptidase n=1 Tax=uncultured Sulfurovum sp. TaxID=269237 RepID=A0A6S6SIM0_9BACT|nr:MAG: D-alanyl-D-alanine dipeptidase [uncultured Sulfurovum sp.]